MVPPRSRFAAIAEEDEPDREENELSRSIVGSAAAETVGRQRRDADGTPRTIWPAAWWVCKASNA